MADRFFRVLDSLLAVFCTIAGVPGMQVLFITLCLLGQGALGTGQAHASESVRFGQIVLEYGNVGHNPLAQPIVDGIMSRSEYSPNGSIYDAFISGRPVSRIPFRTSG